MSIYAVNLTGGKREPVTSFSDTLGLLEVREEMATEFYAVKD